jgi:hypothetical protein
MIGSKGLGGLNVCDTDYNRIERKEAKNHAKTGRHATISGKEKCLF